MPTRTTAIRITGIYLLFAIVWVVFSERVLLALVGESAEGLTLARIIEAWLFVALTGALIFVLLHRAMRRLEQSREAHQRSEARLASLLDTIPYGIAETNLEGTITFSNPAHDRLLGYRPGELVGHKLWELMPEADRGTFRQRFDRVAGRQPKPAPFVTRNQRRDGRVIDVRVHWCYRRDRNGLAVGFTAVVTDITEQLASEARLEEAAAVFDSVGEGIAVVDAGRNFVRVNRAFEEITGYPEAEVVGRSPSLLVSARHPSGFFRELFELAKRTGRWQGEFWAQCRNGVISPEWMSVSAVRDKEEADKYVLVFSDLSAIKESERRVEHLTHFDALTGLPNRFLFEVRLDHAIERAAAERHSVAVVTLDLDRFKNINDSLGHAAGDRILHTLAQRLRESVGSAGTVARPGGDEFSVLLERPESSREVAALAERLLEVIAVPVPLEGQEVFCSSSVGIALFPEDASNASELVKNAEAAMYRAKEFGRDNYQFYTAELTSRAFERLSMETSLRRALERNEFTLYYQPQISLEDGHVVGCEALVRWQHPEMGLVSPSKFIALAEETGLIMPLGRWVLDEACRHASAWNEAGLSLRVAVNVSGKQLARRDLIAHVAEALRRHDIKVWQLELEITESAIMDRAQPAMTNMDDLRDLGVCLAIDDFGTGYSSMNYLKRFPVHRLKVDQSFVRDLPTDPNDRAIAEAIIALGRSLGLTLIAEGVENERQRDFLRNAGCHEMQGFLFSPPVPAEQLPGLISGRLPPATS